MRNSILEVAALYFLYGKKYQLKVKVRKMISFCRVEGSGWADLGLLG